MSRPLLSWNIAMVLWLQLRTYVSLNLLVGSLRLIYTFSTPLVTKINCLDFWNNSLVFSSSGCTCNWFFWVYLNMLKELTLYHILVFGLCPQKCGWYSFIHNNIMYSFYEKCTCLNLCVIVIVTLKTILSASLTLKPVGKSKCQWLRVFRSKV